MKIYSRSNGIAKCFSFIFFSILLIFKFGHAQSSYPPGDVSGMFNERGYNRTNSASSDANEIISDYNGNLMYSVPMFKTKNDGDLYLDFSINYNGSVNYQVFTATLDVTYLNRMPKYNLTAPGWIFSLNGMAVQMFNFESCFFTEPPNQGTVELDNQRCRLLAPGYQITDGLTSSENGNRKDAIFLMKGDGSVLTLRRVSNTSCTGSDPECYIGDYYSDDKGDFSTAKVEYIEPTGYPTFRNRRVSLCRGDGLTYIYEENKIEYIDFPMGVGTEDFKPQVFLLKLIKDRYGNRCELTYDYAVIIQPQGQVLIHGRPLLKRITDNTSHSILFSYNVIGTTASMVMVSYVGNTYKVTADAFSADEFVDHRPMVYSIQNPV